VKWPLVGHGPVVVATPVQTHARPSGAEPPAVDDAGVSLDPANLSAERLVGRAIEE
jgi:hypothetical protein